MRIYCPVCGSPLDIEPEVQRYTWTNDGSLNLELRHMTIGGHWHVTPPPPQDDLMRPPVKPGPENS